MDKSITDEAAQLEEEFRKIPRDVGWILLITGLASEIGLPGVPPFWIAGMMVLWPKTGSLVTRPIRRKFPRSFHRMRGMVRRYVEDLQDRYP